MVEGELSQLPVQFGREPKKHPFRRTRGGSAPSDGCACQRGPHHALRRQGWISGPADRAEGGGLQVFGKTGRNGRINVSPDHPLDQTFWLFCALSTALRKRSKSLAGPYVCEQCRLDDCGGNDAILTMQAVTTIELTPADVCADCRARLLEELEVKDRA